MFNYYPPPVKEKRHEHPCIRRAEQDLRTDLKTHVRGITRHAISFMAIGGESPTLG